MKHSLGCLIYFLSDQHLVFLKEIKQLTSMLTLKSDDNQGNNVLVFLYFFCMRLFCLVCRPKTGPKKHNLVSSLTFGIFKETKKNICSLCRPDDQTMVTVTIPFASEC